MNPKLEELQNQIKGSIITADDATYDSARKTLFNKTAIPIAIVQCEDTQDIIATVAYVRDNNLLVSVRSGGHSGAGLSTNTGGIVIDLSRLNKVEVIDEEKRLVSIESGAVWGDVAAALEPHNLVISAGDTVDVGVGGLTQSGGIGWMVREYGLAIDNLVSAELITADGQLLSCSEEENSDLFWAIRGGSGNFGVVSKFTFRATPSNGIISGNLVFDSDDRRIVLTTWISIMKDAPGKLNSTAVLFPGFGPGSTPNITIMFCYDGTDQDTFDKLVKPLRSRASLQGDTIKTGPYKSLLAKSMDITNMKVRVRNGFVKEVTPELINTIATNFGIPNTPPTQIRSLGGALSDTTDDATAFAHRSAEALIVMPSFTPPTAPDAEADDLADKRWAPVKPFTQGAYSGFLTDSSDASVALAYPEATYERLMKIKETYDPKNIFSQNINIKPVK